MITLSVDGRDLKVLLDDWVTRLSTMEEPLGEILDQVLLDAQHFVDVTKSYWNVPWPPMAESTQRGGRDPSTLLVKSRRLLDSLQKGGFENIYEVGSWSGETGTSVPYAYFLQESLTHPRPFLGWAEERSEYFTNILADFICAGTLRA